MSPSASEKSGELSRSSSVVPTSTYGLSVKRCAAGRSTPTSARTLPGKLSGPNTRNDVSVNWTTEAWKWAASFSVPVLSAAAVKSSIIPLVASARAVAAPTVRRLSSQAAPGSAGEDSRGDGGKLWVRVGSEAVGTQDQIGSRRTDLVQVGRAAGANGGQIVHGSAEIGRLGVGAVGQRGADDARLQAQRAQRIELVAGQGRRSAAARSARSVLPAAWRTSRSPSSGSAGAGSGAQDSSGLR